MITAVLGPNGAGKSTTMEILTGLRLRNTGDVEVLGLDPARQAKQLAERIGVQLQEFNIQPKVKVREILAFFASLYQNPLDSDELLTRFGLTEKRDALFPSLSGGQKRRLAIARALVGDPELLILDEPTSGLDPQGQEFLRHQIRKLRQQDRTVLLSTHDVADAQSLADLVIIIDNGKVIASGSPTELVAEHCLGWRVEVDGNLPETITNNPDLRTMPGISSDMIIYAPDAATAQAALTGHKIGPQRSPNLSDAYLLLTGTDLRV